MPTKEKHFEEYSALATLPLRDVVVYPHMVLPLFVGRPKSIVALEAAMANDDPVLLLAQIDPNTEDPTASDLHRTGTVAQVLQAPSFPRRRESRILERVHCLSLCCKLSA